MKLTIEVEVPETYTFVEMATLLQMIRENGNGKKASLIAIDGKVFGRKPPKKAN